MQPLDWASVFASAPNIVTAVVFGFFVLKMLDRADKEMAKRDVEWRAYLLEARGAYVTSVASMAKEITSLAGSMTTMHDAFTQHDAWSRSEAVRRDAVTAATAAAVASEATKVAAEVASRAAIAAIELQYRKENLDRQDRQDRQEPKAT
jgi:hypothetical protein